MNQFQARTLILSGEVTNDSVSPLIERIITLNMYDDMMDSSQKGYSRQPIVLIVNSGGGSVYDGFALMAAIEMSATKVVTLCLGSAMSMGLAIFLSGHYKLIHELSSLMYHEISTKTQGSLTQLKITTEELERLQMQYDMYVLDNSDVKEDQLLLIRKSKTDWFIDASDAVKLGLADSIIKNGEPVRWGNNHDEDEDDFEGDEEDDI